MNDLSWSPDRLVRRTIAAVLFLFLGLGFGETAPRADAQGVSYQKEVRKVIKQHCVGCHNPNRAEADLDLSSYASIMRGSYSGEIIVSGDPEDSYLYLVAAHEEEPAMPPGGERIPDEDLEVLRAWIAGGIPENASDVAKAGSAEPSGQRAKSEDEPVARVAMAAGAAADANASATQGPARVFQGVRGTPVKALAASSGAGVVAVGGQSQVLLFDALGGQLVRVLPFPEGEPQRLAFSADGSQLLAGGGVHAQSGLAVVWDVASGARVHQCGEEYDVALAAGLSPDHRLVVLGGPEKILKVLDAASGATIHALKKHTGWVLDASFAPDGVIFASVDRDGGVYVWETEAGKTVHSLRGHQGSATAIGWLEAGDELATASEDGTVRVWDMHTGEQVRSWSAHADGVLDMDIADDGVTIVTVGRDRTLRAWTKYGKEVASSEPRATLTTSVAAFGDSLAIVGHYDGSVVAWDYRAGAERLFEVPEDRLTNRFEDVVPADALEDSRRLQPKGPPATATVEFDGLDAGRVLASADALERRLVAAAEKVKALKPRVSAVRARTLELQSEIAELTGDPAKTRSLEESIAQATEELARLSQTVSKLEEMTARFVEDQKSLAATAGDDEVAQAVELHDAMREKFEKIRDNQKLRYAGLKQQLEVDRNELAQARREIDPSKADEAAAKKAALVEAEAELASFVEELKAVLED